MKPALIYDQTCPICSSHKNFIMKRLGDRLEYIPGPADAKDVQYRTPDGKVFSGTRAIERLTMDFPEIRDLSFLLPKPLQELGVRIPGKVPASGIKAIYKASGIVRKSYRAVRRGGCNCGGKK